MNRRGYSSGVEHSTADREVPGSIPGVPYFPILIFSPILDFLYYTNINSCFASPFIYDSQMKSKLFSNRYYFKLFFQVIEYWEIKMGEVCMLKDIEEVKGQGSTDTTDRSILKDR